MNFGTFAGEIRSMAFPNGAPITNLQMITSSTTWVAPMTGTFLMYAVGGGGGGYEGGGANWVASGGGAGALAIKIARLQLNDALSLFMGIKAGGNNYEVNTNGLETYNYNVSDPSLQPISRFNPNIGIGFYLKHKDYFVSLSTPKMLDTKRAKEENGYATAATDQAHYYIAAGRTFEITASFDLVPSVMVRYVNGAPFSTDFTTTAKFDDRFDFGVTYRTDRTFAGLTKINISKKFALGYAYEYSLRSQLVGRANGSNEFFLSYKFN